MSLTYLKPSRSRYSSAPPRPLRRAMASAVQREDDHLRGIQQALVEVALAGDAPQRLLQLPGMPACLGFEPLQPQGQAHCGTIQTVDLVGEHRPGTRLQKGARLLESVLPQQGNGLRRARHAAEQVADQQHQRRQQQHRRHQLSGKLHGGLVADAPVFGADVFQRHQPGRRLPGTLRIERGEHQFVVASCVRQPQPATPDVFRRQAEGQAAGRAVALQVGFGAAEAMARLRVRSK